MNLLSACQHLMEKEEDILSIILSGSRARGDFKENSDYDFLFVTKSNVKGMIEEHEIKKSYADYISKRTDINEDLISIYFWPLKYFRKEYNKGNSFIYCALRDGKIISSRYDLNLKLPQKCRKAAADRINLAKANIERIEFSLGNFEEWEPGYLELEDLGYCAMHICWAVCLLNDFCPVSKYTVLKESKKYFNADEFKTIKKVYGFYACKGNMKIGRKDFVRLLNSLKKIIERIEK